MTYKTREQLDELRRKVGNPLAAETSFALLDEISTTLKQQQAALQLAVEALEHYARAAVLLPGEASPLIHQAILLRGLDRPGAADASYAEALRRDPGNPLALFNRANLRAALGDTEGAQELLEAAAATCAERQPPLCDAIAAARSGGRPAQPPSPGRS